MARVLLLPEALDELADLDGSARELVFKTLKKLRTDPENHGAPLGSGLTTFRKLIVGNRQYRVVYRVESNDTIVVVWVIATRVDSECYDLAMARLASYGNRDVATELQGLLQDVFNRPPD